MKETWAYGRVSSQGQNLDRQMIVFKERGIDERHIKTDKASGKDFNRPAFLSLVGTDEVAPCMREGDELVILSLDRLGRNYTEIKYWWQYITQILKVDINIIDMPELSKSCTGNTLEKQLITALVLEIFAFFCEQERESIKNAKERV